MKISTSTIHDILLWICLSLVIFMACAAIEWRTGILSKVTQKIKIAEQDARKEWNKKVLTEKIATRAQERVVRDQRRGVHNQENERRAQEISRFIQQYSNGYLTIYQAEQGRIEDKLYQLVKGCNFSDYPEEDRGNFMIAMAACWIDDRQFQHVTEDLQNDKGFVLAVISHRPLVLRFVNQVLQDDLTVVLAAVGGSQAVEQHMSAEEQELLPYFWDFEGGPRVINRDFKGDPRAKKYASPRLQENEIVRSYKFRYDSVTYDASSNHRAAPAGSGADSKTCSESAIGIELPGHQDPLSAGGFANRVGHDAPSPGSGDGIPQDTSSSEQSGISFTT